jgi:hypothetical protein
MRELEKVPVQRMPEVIERAARLQDQAALDLEAAQAKGDLVRAAQEVGIAPDYMRQAATELARADAAAATRRRKRAILIAAALLLLALIGGLVHATRPAATWRDAIEQGASAWQLKTDPKTQAAVTFTSAEGALGQAAAITIQQLAPADAKPYINLASLDPIDLSGHQSLQARARAEGLRALRVDLEASPTERWRSPNQPLSADWRDLDIPLSRFERQTRPSPQDPWRVDTWTAPKRARVVIKLGDTINDPAATPSGTVWIDHITSR